MVNDKTIERMIELGISDRNDLFTRMGMYVDTIQSPRHQDYIDELVPFLKQYRADVKQEYGLGKTDNEIFNHIRKYVKDCNENGKRGFSEQYFRIEHIRPYMERKQND